MAFLVHLRNAWNRVFVVEVICWCSRDVNNNIGGGSMVQIRLGVSLNGKKFSAFVKVTLGHRDIPQELEGRR